MSVRQNWFPSLVAVAPVSVSGSQAPKLPSKRTILVRVTCKKYNKIQMEKIKNTPRGAKNQAEGIAIDKATVDGVVERWDGGTTDPTVGQKDRTRRVSCTRFSAGRGYLRYSGRVLENRIGSDRRIGWANAGMGAGYETTLARPAVSSQRSILGPCFDGLAKIAEGSRTGTGTSNSNSKTAPAIGTATSSPSTAVHFWLSMMQAEGCQKAITRYQQ